MIAPYQKRGLQTLRIDKDLFFLPHVLAAADDYEALQEEKRRCREDMCRCLGADQVFFSSVRHVWAGANAQLADSKGNDIAVRAFSLYCEKNRRVKNKLLLINKGYDLAASQRLIQALRLEGAVVWMDQIPRDRLADYYRGTTLCLGQFGTPVLTGAALEPLSFATPSVSYYTDNAADIPYYASLPPVHNSRDPETIAGFMDRIVQDGAYAEEVSRSSWEWVRRHCSEEVFAETFQKALA